MNTVLVHILIPVVITFLCLVFLTVPASNLILQSEGRLYVITPDNYVSESTRLAKDLAASGAYGTKTVDSKGQEKPPNSKVYAMLEVSNPWSLDSFKMPSAEEFSHYLSIGALRALMSREMGRLHWKMKRLEYVVGNQKRRCGHIVSVVANDCPPHAILIDAPIAIFLDKSYLEYLDFLGGDFAGGGNAGGNIPKIISLNDLVANSVESMQYTPYWSAALLVLTRGAGVQAPPGQNGQPPMSSLVMAASLPSGYKGDEPGGYAEFETHIKLLEFVLEHGGADVEALDATFETVTKGTGLLHACAIRHDFSTAAIIMNKGADVLLTDEHGRTALHFASAAANNMAVEEHVRAIRSPNPCLAHPLSYKGVDTSYLCGSKKATRSDLAAVYGKLDAKVGAALIRGCEGKEGLLS
jgi:hypothetical protein